MTVGPIILVPVFRGGKADIASDLASKEQDFDMPLMTSDDLADYLGVPKKTLEQWRYLGKGPAYAKVGKHVRYRRSDVDAWVDSRIVGP